MYCSQCGCENPDAASFCKSCGKPIRKPEGTAASFEATPEYPRGLRVDTVRVRSDRIPRGGIVIQLGGLLLVAAIAIGIAIAVIGPGSGRGRFTSKQLAKDLSASFSQLFSSGLTESSMTSFSSDLIDMMPREAVDAALEEAGITDRTEASELVGGSDVLNSISSLTPYIERLRVDCSFFVGDEISPSELDSINSVFEKEGIAIRASSGNRLGMNMSVIALEDVQGLTKGESQTQTIEDMGLYAIKVKGRWYLWGDIM